MKITKNISVHETFFTEYKKGRVFWWQLELLPIISIAPSRILIGWLSFTMDIHHTYDIDKNDQFHP